METSVTTGVWFIGNFEKPVDSKNRIVVPRSFRETLESQELILMRWYEHTLALFPINAWEPLAEKARQMSLAGGPDKRGARLSFFSGALSQRMDNQGRIVLSKDMKQYAGINGEAVILGDGDRVQIIAPNRYAIFRENQDDLLSKGLDEILAETEPPQFKPRGVTHSDSSEEMAENSAEDNDK
ncbi:MAG TPA: hypothetical protein PLZ55_01990 [bacterium]|nr:hypothetical protein [bacterium]HPO07412.1 hypothetical protein [bacterium]HQO35320.1 hypothetical protein [bacterium]HQP98627.1 hypothetical protein [bacterium]